MRDFVFVGRFLKIACLKKIVGGAEKIPKVYVGGGGTIVNCWLLFEHTHTRARSRGSIGGARRIYINRSVVGPRKRRFI